MIFFEITNSTGYREHFIKKIKMFSFYGKVKILSIIFILYSPERIVDGSEMSSVLKSIMIIKLSDWYFKWN